MRLVRSDGSIIEGTAAEIAEFEAIQRLREPPKSSAVTKTGGAHIEASSATGQDWEYVSAELAFRALTRLKLSKQQKATISLIYSGDKGWTSASDIQREIDYTPSQFAGLMGAFGRRLVNTPGYVLHSAFFEQEWDSEKSCYVYRLPPSVRTAVEKARIVG